MAEPIRVLVVDDSAFMRKVLKDLLEGDPGVVVVGVAKDGIDALEKAAALRPDVITLDVEMPRLDGLQCLQRLMAENPTPLVMVSSLTQRGADATIRALALGAVDFVAKPSGAISLDLHLVRDEVVAKVRAAAQVPMRRLQPLHPLPAVAVGHSRLDLPGHGRLSGLVLVAVSTGGPGMLHRLLAPLPADLAAGVLVVQHMPPGFTRSLAAHLDQATGLTVREAGPGDRLEDGLVLVAPGGSHLLLREDRSVTLDGGPPRHGVRPAADVTFESLPVGLIRRSVVLVLTGMGSDGALGARYLKARGATVWAQDEGSAVIYGMPRVVTEMGVAERSGTPEQLAAWVAARMADSWPIK